MAWGSTPDGLEAAAAQATVLLGGRRSEGGVQAVAARQVWMHRPCQVSSAPQLTCVVVVVAAAGLLHVASCARYKPLYASSRSRSPVACRLL
jgi:hypothetical protein